MRSACATRTASDTASQPVAISRVALERRRASIASSGRRSSPGRCDRVRRAAGSPRAPRAPRSPAPTPISRRAWLRSLRAGVDRRAIAAMPRRIARTMRSAAAAASVRDTKGARRLSPTRSQDLAAAGIAVDDRSADARLGRHVTAAASTPAATVAVRHAPAQRDPRGDSTTIGHDAAVERVGDHARR